MPAPVGVSFLYPAAPIISFLAVVGLLLPSPSHFKSRNTGTLLYIFWGVTVNLIVFIDVIVWRGNVNNPAPVWCDIASKILVIGPVALSCSTLCITRKLWKVSRVSAVIITDNDKRRDTVIDLSIGLGIPALVAALHYVVQGHRFDIIEDFGCSATIYTAYISVPLYYAWPLGITLISFVYGVLALRQFLRRRKDLEELLSSTNTGISANRYLRLMWLSCIEVVLGIPINLFNFVEPFKDIRPWISWEDTHSNFGRVAFLRRILIDQVPSQKILLTLIVVAYAFYGWLFFFLFGFGNDAVKSYGNIFYFVMKPFGIVRPSRNPGMHLAVPKRTFLDKILRRPAQAPKPLMSVSASMPTFDHGKSVGSSTTRQKSPTATFDWDLDLEDPRDKRSKAVVAAFPKQNTSYGSTEYDEKTSIQ